MNNFEPDQAASAPNCASAISSSAEANDRYHSLDGLRALMMLLGLVLHSAISYGTAFHSDAWPYQDNNTSPFFDVCVLFIHSFRMPLFFILAGFFAALLITRRGLAAFLRNRCSRILIPFVVGWIVLAPLTILGFAFATQVKEHGIAEAFASTSDVAEQASFIVDSTIHLWFLYYLLFFYAAVALLSPLLQRTPGVVRSANALFEQLLRSPLRVPLLATPLAAVLMTMPGAVLKTSTSFVPDLPTFAVYFGFFAFGFALHSRAHWLQAFANRAWRTTGVACGVFVLYLGAVEEIMNGDPLLVDAAQAVAAVTGAVATWLLILGITGLFVRYAHRPSRVTRYFVDASYWLYLTHLPLTIWLPGLFAGIAAPAALKFAAVLGIVTIVLVVLYETCVRSTRIGQQLSGRRYPHGLPRLDT